MMSPKRLVRLTIGLFFIAATGCGPEAEMDLSEATGESHVNDNYEVWLLDQSNTNGLTYGGKIYIYDGDDLDFGDVSGAQPLATVDLSGDASALCFAQTAANPVRPHMIFFNRARTHAIVSFVASGHVVIFNATTRAALACFRTSAGAAGARQAHAAFPSRDERYIIVANQNGKRLERIDTNYSTNTFTLNAAATLDLATCVTPNGVPCELAGVRPDNAPICPIVDQDSRRTWVTLRGGGLFVVDHRTTPMSIIGEYDNTTIHGNGCGGIQANSKMFIDSGGALAANLTEFDVYAFPISGYSASNPPNTPARTLVYSDDNATFERDAHGMVTTGDDDRYVWVLDRRGDRAEVFRTSTNARVNTVTIAHPSAADPSADLGVTDPDRTRMFVSLRGPNPLSGDPHISVGSTPGLGVIDLNYSGSGGSMISVIPITNVDSGGVERADAHGIAMRRR